MELAIAPTCEHCRYVRTFAPRSDEQERYGFGEIGYRCRYPGWEGYTRPDHWCSYFFRQEPAEPAPAPAQETNDGRLAGHCDSDKGECE